jgi:hypothetical protein
MKTTFVLLCVCLSIVAGCSFWRYASWTRPRRGFQRLLAGDESVRVTSLVLEGENGRAVVDDPAVLEYLTRALRSPVPDGIGSGGVAYYATLHLSSGGSVLCRFIFAGEQGVVSVSEPIDVWFGNDPFDCYRVRFPEPIPERLMEVMPRLAGSP